MTMLGLRYPIALLSVLALVCGLGGCQTEAGNQPADDVINLGFDGGTVGCSQPTFPSEQPDLSVLNPPIFLLTNNRSQQSAAGQAQVNPGEPMEAEIAVNGATRQVKVELANAWASDQVIYSTEETTSGNDTLSVVLFSEESTRGRYFMKLTLCGFDCDERQVVFDLHPCADDREPWEPCGINVPYDRTLIEEGETVRVDGTCVDLRATPGVGSGTVLIQ